MITLREATASDILAIRTIAQAAWPAAYTGIISPEQIAYMLELMYSISSLTEQLEQKGHRFLLAEQDGDVIGFASFEHHYSPERSRLHKLYVLPDALGKGVGHQLMEAVFTEAMERGDREIELNVNKHNRAKHFYERHGFTVERDEVLDIGHGFVMDDHVMVKRLG